jgi:hypothetical protein
MIGGRIWVVLHQVRRIKFMMAWRYRPMSQWERYDGLSAGHWFEGRLFVGTAMGDEVLWSSNLDL